MGYTVLEPESKGYQVLQPEQQVQGQGYKVLQPEKPDSGVQNLNSTIRAFTPGERLMALPAMRAIHDAIMGPAIQPSVGMQGALPIAAQIAYGNVKPEVSKGVGVLNISPGTFMPQPQTEAQGVIKGLLDQVNLQNVLIARMLGPLAGSSGTAANLAKAGLGAYFTEQGVEQGAQAAGRRYSGVVSEGEKGTEDVGMALGGLQALGGPFLSMPESAPKEIVNKLPEEAWYAGPRYQLPPAGARVEIGPTGEATDIQGPLNRAAQLAELKQKQQATIAALRAMRREGVDVNLDRQNNDPLGIEIRPQQTYEQVKGQEETRQTSVQQTGEPAKQASEGASNVPAEVRQGADANAQGRLLAPAKFKGIQKGYKNIPDIELYDLTQDIPGHPKGSTIGRPQLESLGYRVPQRAEEGSLAQDLVPAIATDNGIIKATSDEMLSHDDVLKANKIEPASIPHEDPRRGFVDSMGNWYTRKQAEEVTGLKGTAEAGGLDSMDLPRASYEKGVHAEDWKNAQAAAEKSGTKLYGGLFFMDPDFWRDQIRIAGNVKTDGQMLYNRMRNALGKDSATWKSVDTEEFRKFVVGAGRVSPDEVKKYLEKTGLAEVAPQFTGGTKLFSGVPIFDPELLGISPERAAELKDKYLKMLAAKGQSLPGDLAKSAKQFAPKSARAAAILGSTTARPMERTQELIAQPGEKLGVGERAGNTIRRAFELASEGDKIVNPWDVIYDWLDGGRAKYNGPLMENIRKPLDADFRDELRLRNHLLEPLEKLTKGKMGKAQGERIGVYLNTLQEGGRDRMIASGITPETIAKIEKTITPAEIKVAQAIRSMYDQTFPLIQKVAKDVDGIDLNPIDNYFSWEREWRKYKPDADELASPKVPKNGATVDDVLWPGLEAVRSRAKPGSLEKRVPGAATPIKVNAFEIANRYARDAAHYIAMRKHLKEISEIVRDTNEPTKTEAGYWQTTDGREFESRKEAVAHGETLPRFRDKYGAMGQDLIMEHLNTIARQGRYERNKYLDGLRRLTSRGIISWRLPSQFVHLANVPLAMLRTGVPEWYKGFDDALSDEGQAFLKYNFPETFERGGGEPALREVADSEIGKQNLYTRAGQLGFAIQRWIDRMNAQATVLAIYKKELAKKGKNPEDFAELPVDEAAVSHALVLARRAVASPLYKDVPPILNRKMLGSVSLSKSLLQFQNTFLDQWSNIRYDLPESIRNKDPKTAFKTAAAIFAMLMVETGVKYGYKQGKSAIIGTKQKEDDTFSKTLEHEALRRIPGMGQLQAQIVYGQTGVPSIDALEEPVKQGVKYFKSPDKAGKINAATRAGFGLAEVGGVPGASQAKDIVSDIERKKLFKSHTQRLKEQEGKDVEKMTLRERYAAEAKYKKTEPPMSKMEQASAAKRSIANITKRGEEVSKELDKPMRNWVESRGLTIPGYDNKLKIGKEDIYLDENEMDRLHSYIKDEYVSAITQLRTKESRFDKLPLDEQKVYFNEALLAARSRARFKLMQELSRSKNEPDKEQGKKKKFSIFNND